MLPVVRATPRYWWVCDPDELLRGADDEDLAAHHNERAGILEYDGGLDRNAATAHALARLLETLNKRRSR